MRLLLTRGLEDAEPLALALQARGHQTLIDPMMSVEYMSVAGPDINTVQALLITSANGIRALSQQTWITDQWRDEIPVYAVGDASAQAARQSGFRSVTSASGDVDDLANLVIDNASVNEGRLLHIAGSKVAGDLSGQLTEAGFHCQREVLYKALRCSSLSEQTRAALSRGQIEGVLFYSPRTADIFISLAIAANIVETLQKVTVYCLSSAVAGKTGSVGWRKTEVCESPDQDSMIRLIDSTG